jgi:hypothetical protein
VASSGIGLVVAKRFVAKGALAPIRLPEDVAAACLFLASKESSYGSGIDLPVDGGLVCRVTCTNPPVEPRQLACSVGIDSKRIKQSMTDDMDETARAEFLLMKLLPTRSGSFSSVFLRYALAVGFLSAVADRFGLWGSFGQPNVSWASFSRFLEYTDRLNWYLPATNDPTARGYHDGRGVALRSSSCRLAHTRHRVAERISPDVVRARHDARIRSQGAPEFFRFRGGGRGLASRTQ